LILTIIAGNAADLYAPLLYKRLFDTLALGDGKAVASLVTVLLLILGVRLIHWLFWRVYWYTNSTFYARVMSDLLNTCFEYLQRHSYNFFNNNFAGGLVRRVNRYPKAFEEIADQLTLNIGQAVLRVGVILAILYFRHWALAAIIFGWAVVYTAFSIWFSRYKLKYDAERAKVDTKTTAHLADTIANNINLKIFGGTLRETESFRGVTDELYRIRRFTWILGWSIDSVQGLFAVLLEFGIFYAAVGLWQQGILTVGDFVLIQAYLLQIFWVLWDMGRYIRRMYESVADAAEMTEILTTPHEIQDAPGAGNLRVTEGAIEFQDVSFRYHSKKSILKHFDFKVVPGERVALIGPSGGGKSTVVRLLLRFYDIESGAVLIDGQNIAGVTQESLRDVIALVPQDSILFHRTLLENIRYARPSASDDEVKEAARLAHCHEFISEFPDGYETYVGERGVKLSGGERQRVAIARAILKDAPILVLDEATSSLDSGSEQLIQDALKNLMKGRTTVVIAHRLSTIMQMDRIVVIEKGAIVEEGKHEELLKAKQGIYQKLWRIQAGGFALPPLPRRKKKQGV
ncbi:MAG: ABC transporter ATP-binding protein, partial [Patescibacteria group bacterium]